MLACNKQGLKSFCKFFAHTQHRDIILRKCQSLTCGIIVTGDEILKGEIQETNSCFLCKELSQRGIKVAAVTKVADDVEIISSAVKKFSETYDYVLTTGGVGSTFDDVTYEAVGKAFNDKLFYHPLISDAILKFYKITDFKHPALKMALVPTTSKLTYGFDPQTNKKSLFPNVSVKNVYMFPGIPRFCRKLFRLTENQIFQSKGKKIYAMNLYAVGNEIHIASYLNKAVQKHPKVMFGSYPKFSHNYYDVKISLESGNEAEVNDALHYLKQIIPKESLIEYDGNPFSNKLAKISAFKDPCVRDTLNGLREIVKRNSPDNIFLYFDGGKNSTVLLHILSAVYEEAIPNSRTEVNAIYVERNSNINTYIESSVKKYNLNLLKLSENCFRTFTKSNSTIVIIKGTRLSDPDAPDVLNYFKGFPVYNPLERWTYADVWKIIRGLSLPYCKLYNRGYTSICQRDSHPNPHLLKIGPRTDSLYYKKAFELENPDLENVGESPPQHEAKSE